MIEVRNLYHSYTRDHHYAVQDLSFGVRKGEIFGFLGPSGAGKSTTQNILTGLLPLQRGDVSIAGQDLRKVGRSLYERIGVSFERANHYRRLSGLENLQFFSRLYSVPTEDPMQLLRMVGLDEPADRLRLQQLMDESVVETVHTQEASLEQIFIKLTGKELA